MLIERNTSRSLFQDVDQLRRTVDALFNGLHSGGFNGRHGLIEASRRLYPLIHVDETDAAFVITADVPGLSAADLGVRFEDGVLTLSGAHSEVEEDGWTLRASERGRWNFERSVRFREPVDADAIEATVRDGVLRVTVPRRPKPAARQITVQST